MTTSMIKKLAVAAIFSSFIIHSAWADAIPASAYVRRGLVAHFDGIENAGTGIHDANATEWVNLATADGKCGDARLLNGAFTVQGDRISFDKGRMVASNLVCATSTSSITIEARVKATTAKTTNHIPFLTVENRAMIGFDARDNQGFAAYVPSTTAMTKNYFFWYSSASYASYYSTPATYSYVAGINTGTFCKDAGAIAQRTTWTGAAANNGPDGTVYIGNTGVSYDVYSARVYNRELSAEEITINDNIDKVRFGGADPASLTWSEASGYRLNPETSKLEFRVTIDCIASHGAVSVNGAVPRSGHFEVWVDATNATVTITATPAGGCCFKQWQGDVAGLADVTQVTQVVPNGPTTFAPIFTANDIHYIPGDFASINEAMASENVHDGDIVYLLDGTHVFEQMTYSSKSYCGVITNAVTVMGRSPDSVIIDCGGAGGLYVNHTSAVVANVTIQNFQRTVNSRALNMPSGTLTNSVINGGATKLMSCSDRSSAVNFGAGALVVDCTLRHIYKTQWDSSGCISVSGATLRRTTVRNNSANNFILYMTAGGGHNARVENCLIRNNSDYYKCGVAGSDIDVIDCEFRGNSCSDQSGGLLDLGGHSTVVNCIATNNTMNGTLPLVTCEGGAVISITNCLFAKNTIASHGVFQLGSFTYSSKTFNGGKNTCLELVNTTVANNKTTSSDFAGGFTGKGTSTGNARVVMINSVVWGNTANNVAKDFLDSYAYTDFYCTNSCFAGLTPTAGENNTDLDPHFADPAHCDFRLGDGSSCIDAGMDMPEVAFDLDGKARPIDGIGTGTPAWDIGCYEAPAPVIPLKVVLSTFGEHAVSPCSATQLVAVTGAKLTGLTYEWWSIREVGETAVTNKVLEGGVENVFENLEPGVYSFVSIVRNDQGDAVTNVAERVFRAKIDTCYVALDGGNEWPYDTSAKAARKLTDALDLAENHVILAHGTYTFDHLTDPVLNMECQAALHTPVSIEGAADPADVVIDCGGKGGIVLNHAGAKLCGVTFRNSQMVDGSGSTLYVKFGSVSNIVICGTGSAAKPGHFLYLGDRAFGADVVISNCTVTASSGVNVLGLNGATLTNALVTGCASRTTLVYANKSAGGTRSKVYNLRILDNALTSASAFTTVESDAYGMDVSRNNCSNKGADTVQLKDAKFYDCRIVGNTGSGSVRFNVYWGANYADMRNCLVLGNHNGTSAAVSATDVASRGRLHNCTVAYNDSTSAAAGGVCGYDGEETQHGTYITLLNSIVSGNTTNGVPCDVGAKQPTYNFTYSAFLEAGGYPNAHNISANAGVKRDGTLSNVSPCFDAGQSQTWHAEGHDLNGGPRVLGKGVDLGCFECLAAPGTMLIMR